MSTMSELYAKLAEVTDGYTFRDGIIREPGKFEGETVATLYYYDAYLNGDGCVMTVSDEERSAFGLSTDDKYVYLAESNDGFVSLEFYATQAEAEEREAEELEPDEDMDEDMDEAQYPACPICSTINSPMGSLGSKTWYRCQACGMDYGA